MMTTKFKCYETTYTENDDEFVVKVEDDEGHIQSAVVTHNGGEKYLALALAELISQGKVSSEDVIRWLTPAVSHAKDKKESKSS